MVLQVLQEYLPQLIATVIAILIIAAMRVAIRKIISKYVHSDSKTGNRNAHIIRICVLFTNIAGAIMLIAIWGVDTRNLLVALSSMFAVIGVAFFAQWSILSNVTAGLMLFFASPFRIGDNIRILDKDYPLDARIEDIQTLYTYLRTTEGELYIIPNNLFLQKTITIAN